MYERKGLVKFRGKYDGRQRAANVFVEDECGRRLDVIDQISIRNNRDNRDCR